MILSKIKIGDMRERIIFQSPTKTSDDLGGYSYTWSNEITVWAKAWSISSSELNIDLKVNMVRIYKFVIRYRSSILPSWRISWGSRYFNITGIDPDQNREFLYLTAEEIV